MKNIFCNTEDLIKNKETYKKIFFYRVCGTGMGAAATLLKEAGYFVEGGDIEFYPPMSDYLKNSGIILKKISDCSDEYLQSFDLIIVGNVVPGKSEEAKRLEGLGVNLTSFPQALGGLFLTDKKVVGISGTHGKTTTTYLGVQVFNKLGMDVGYLIGGVLPDGPSAKMGNNDLFFIEADEYDTAYFEKTSKFLHYEIDHLIVTSLEYDHADIFKNESAMLESFHLLLKRKFESKILNLDYPMTKELARDHYFDHFYGEENSDFGPLQIEERDHGSSFQLRFKGDLVRFETNIIGKHNILNLSSIIILAMNLGYSADKINKAICDLSMVKRRQEERGNINGAILIDDFAHHPTAISKTLDAILHKYKEKKIITIFEPASSTARSNLFQNRYVESFKDADEIIIIPPARKTTVLSGDDLDLNLLMDELRSDGKTVYQINELKTLEKKLTEISTQNDVIVTLSNGKVLNLFSSLIINK